jgi:signal transduction histidine kinase
MRDRKASGVPHIAYRLGALGKRGRVDLMSDPHTRDSFLAPSPNSVETLTYALASSDSLEEAVANAARLVQQAVASEASVRIAIPAASGRLRIAWRSGPDSADGPRLRSARRSAFELRAYRSVELGDVGSATALFFPLVWRDRSLGVLEIQTASDPSLQRRGTVAAITCQLAGVLAGLAERHQLEQQVMTFEATADVSREMLRAGHPEAALGLAANALWQVARRPVAVWWAEPDATRNLVAVVGLGGAARIRLVDILLQVHPMGNDVTSDDRSRVIGHIVEALGGSTRITSGTGDRCVVVVAARGAVIERHVEMVTGLIDDTLPLVASSAKHELEVSSFDLGLAWTAHELRTPILGVKAALETVASRTDPSAGEVLRLSVDELARLASDAEGILGWATGRHGLDLERVDVAALVLDTVMNDRQFQGHATRITVDAQDPVIARVDPTQLRVAVANIVRNALAYAAGGGVTVTVRGDEGVVRVSVQDAGPGLTDSDREGIFEPFARGAASARHPGGSGLGLFISRHVAEAHGGRTWVDSDGLGRGATFHIEVPTASEALQRPAS